MAEVPTTGTEGTEGVSPVTSPQPTPQPDTSGITKKGPAAWVQKLRPQLSATPTHTDRLKQLHFDAFFAGAKANGRWEDEWPMMTEKEFSQAVDAVANLELGGHRPDGSHPRSGKE